MDPVTLMAQAVKTFMVMGEEIEQAKVSAMRALAHGMTLEMERRDPSLRDERDKGDGSQLWN